MQTLNAPPIESSAITEAKIEVATATGWTEALKAIASGLTAIGAAAIALGLALVARIQQGEKAVTEPGAVLMPAVVFLILALVTWFGVAASSVRLAGKQRALIHVQAGRLTAEELKIAAVQAIAQAHREPDQAVT